MKIFIGADHNGYELKEHIQAFLLENGYEVVDKGDERFDKNDDFPLFAGRVSSEVLATDHSKGILICGSGQGMCIAANRFKGIRASLVWNEDEAYDARNDDDSNILCFPARQITNNEAIEILKVWLKAPFSGAARFKRRIKQLDELN